MCVYGIIGLPKSLAELEEPTLQKNIQLGLDLRGGSHLILQVQVQDAVKVEADQAMERLKEELRKAGIDYASMDRNDPTTHRGGRFRSRSTSTASRRPRPADFRRIVAERFPALGADAGQFHRLPDEHEAHRDCLTMKTDTVERSIQTIEQRINGLGLTEPVVQQYGRRGRGVRDSGAIARRGRSGAREGDHADGGDAGDLPR